MRKRINIVWLDDRLMEPLVKGYKRTVEKFLKELGYVPDCHCYDNYQKAIDYSKDKRNRVDFFITDYNLTEEKSGLDFLIELRKIYDYKQPLILYSAENESNIKNNIKNAFDEYELKHLTNFHFFSTRDNDFAREVKDILRFILYKWDELNALRSFYISEHAVLEGRLSMMLKSSKDTTDPSYANYIQRLESFCREKALSSYDSLLFAHWARSRKIRNSLSHCEEIYSDAEGYYIESLIDNTTKINEGCIVHYRRQMTELQEKIDQFLVVFENELFNDIKNWSKDKDFSVHYMHKEANGAKQFQ